MSTLTSISEFSGYFMAFSISGQYSPMSFINFSGIILELLLDSVSWMAYIT